MLLSLSGVGGCAEATIATASTLVGVAAAGISTGADVYRMGKLNSADLARLDQSIDAVHAAAGDMHFVIEKEEYYATGKWRCTLSDERKTRIRIYLERRTQTLCWTKIDVGIFGSEPTARLILARMRQHVPTSQPFGAESPSAPISAP